jgi:DNA-binding NarL/FixJ family response regulator
MIRILIADDHSMVRAGIRQWLAADADLQVTLEAGSGQEAIDALRNNPCDLVLLDISMPGWSGVETLQRIQKLRPGLPVLILSGYPEKQYAINLLRAGAAGYISKDCPPEQLIEAIRTAGRGQKYLSPALAQMLALSLSSSTGNAPLHESLSQREFQIFRKLASGLSVSAIAEGLNLSVKTISTYRSRLLEKMGMQTNAELTSYALRNGLID